jgi:uncharacterized protein
VVCVSSLRFAARQKSAYDAVMGPQLIEHLSPGQFHNAVLPWLLEFEAAYCTQIGLLLRMADGIYEPVSVDELDRPLLLTVENDDRIELVALQTLKTKMLVTRGSDEAMRCLAEALAHRRWNGHAVLGFSPSVEVLAEHYAQRSGSPRRLVERLRIFQLTAVSWPASVSGSMRLCMPSDRQVLAQFLAAFAADIGEPSDEDNLSRADRLIESQRLFLWMDQQPVAMAAWAGRTPNGIRINSVYTPPEFRRRGYASNLVAHLTQRLLDEGHRFCFLHTDQANPTSNSIYRKIGYRPVCDCEGWEFR